MPNRERLVPDCLPDNPKGANLPTFAYIRPLTYLNVAGLKVAN